MPILNKKSSEPIKLKLFEPPKPDIFDRVELPADEKFLYSQEFKDAVEEAVKKAVEAMPKPEIPEPKPQIVKEIKEVRVEVPAKDTRDLVEMSEIKKLHKVIKDLQEELKETRRKAENPVVITNPGGSGVIGIPGPEGNEGKTLKVLNNKAAWVTLTGSGGGSLAGYTVDNHTELKELDESSVTLDQLAQVVGTIINELS